MTTSLLLQRLGLVAALLIAAGCERRAGVPSEPQPAVQPKTPVATAPALDQPELVAEALRWLERWAAAQTRGDQQAYFASYDAQRFEGIKRTAGGGQKRYDFAAWKADREAMVQRSPAVRVSLGQVRTWLDGHGLDAGTCELEFEQGFVLGEYRDHGTKLLRVQRDGPDAFRIVREEMLDSAPGLDFTGMPDRPFEPAVRGAATQLELRFSDRVEPEGEAPRSRTLLTVRSQNAVTTVHLDSDLALGAPAWDAEREIVLKSPPFAGRWVQFRIQRQGAQLVIAKRHGDEAEAPEPWTPYAKLALGGRDPLPFSCAEAGRSAVPCSQAHPTL